MKKENMNKWWNKDNKKEIKDLLKDKNTSKEIYDDIINIINMRVDFDIKRKVKGNMDIYVLVSTVILAVNAIIILNFYEIKEYLYDKLNYDINLFIILFMLNLVIILIIYSYKKLFQNK